MKRRAALLGCAFAFTAFAFGGVVDDDEADKDLKRFQGVWGFESREIAGKKVPDEENKGLTVTFDGDKVVVKQGDETVMAGTQKLDPSKTPKEIDVTVTEGDQAGTVLLGIYEIDEDTLKVCFDWEGKNRPTEFKTEEGSTTFVNIHKRKK